MRSSLRRCCLIVASALFCFYLPVQARPGNAGDGDGPAMTNPGGGNGNGNGRNGGDHSPGPPATPPGNSGGTQTKIHGPQGTCTADNSTGLDLQGPDGQSGASHVAHTDFGMIDPVTGDPVASPSSATMMYFWYGSTFDYVLNAHQLPVGSQWTLTYQPEPLPSAGVLCLGNATVNGGGQLHLANSIELNSNLPPALDPTADPSTQPPDALLALVLSADVDCTGGTMTNFEPDVYLWSNPRVRYIDTDLLPPAP
ncbi:MAG TPA: hypothetical protein VLB69_10830 [Rudaea sp.]|nr:hypothetical protein [Rudaea sp.]